MAGFRVPEDAVGKSPASDHKLAAIMVVNEIRTFVSALLERFGDENCMRPPAGARMAEWAAKFSEKTTRFLDEEVGGLL